MTGHHGPECWAPPVLAPYLLIDHQGSVPLSPALVTDLPCIPASLQPTVAPSAWPGEGLSLTILLRLLRPLGFSLLVGIGGLTWDCAGPKVLLGSSPPPQSRDCLLGDLGPSS